MDAARRLVDARRELAAVIRGELGSSSSSPEDSRKIYAITGHGVQVGLLRGLVDAARGWLSNASASSGRGQSPCTKISFANMPDSPLLDRSRMRIVDDLGVADELASLPSGWERDFEMYMVVMDRMGSRLASLVIPPPGVVEGGNAKFPDEDDADAAPNGSGFEVAGDATLGTGSVVTPSRLKWRDDNEV